MLDFVLAFLLSAIRNHSFERALNRIYLYISNMDIVEVSCNSALTAIAVVVLSVIYYCIKYRNVLPGPMGVPYLGLYPFLTDENCHQKLDEYKKKYGDLFSFTYSGRLFINLGSVKAIRELHVNHSDCFQGRYTDFNVLVAMLGNGVTMINGEPWKILRKFFLQKFRDRGLYTIRDSMAGPVYDSLNATIDDLKSVQGRPTSVLELITKRCAVTMRKIVFGDEGITEDELQTVNKIYGQSLGGMMGVNMLLMGPFAKFIFTVNPTCRNSLQNHQILIKILSSCSKKIESFMNEEHPSCIIEDYYKERNQRRQKNDPTWKIFTDEALVESILQFVGDGIAGVAGFIGVFLYALLKHPEEQEKLYKELMEVVGPNRQPVLEDKVNLPYLSAFISEVLRENTFMFMFPSLECTKETTVRGYRIPKGSITLLNFYSAHHDPDTYEDPDSFKPSRYMPEADKPKAEPPVLFGMGKRSCSGEAFAVMQCFLFLATIVKNFKIVSSDDPVNLNLNLLISGQLKMTLTARSEN